MSCQPRRLHSGAARAPSRMSVAAPQRQRSVRARLGNWFGRMDGLCHGGWVHRHGRAAIGGFGDVQRRAACRSMQPPGNHSASGRVARRLGFRMAHGLPPPQTPAYERAGPCRTRATGAGDGWAGASGLVRENRLENLGPGCFLPDHLTRAIRTRGERYPTWDRRATTQQFAIDLDKQSNTRGKRASAVRNLHGIMQTSAKLRQLIPSANISSS